MEIMIQNMRHISNFYGFMLEEIRKDSLDFAIVSIHDAAHLRDSDEKNNRRSQSHPQYSTQYVDTFDCNLGCVYISYKYFIFRHG